MAYRWNGIECDTLEELKALQFLNPNGTAGVTKQTNEPTKPHIEKTGERVGSYWDRDSTSDAGCRHCGGTACSGGIRCHAYPGHP